MTTLRRVRKSALEDSSYLCLALDQSKKNLSLELILAARKYKLNSRAVQSYQYWVGQYLVFCKLENPLDLTEGDAIQFLTSLIHEQTLSRARLNQAKEAIFFLYEKVLQQPLKQQEFERLALIAA